MADLYSNYVDSTMKALDEQYRRKMGELQQTLAAQGIMQSPASAQYYGELTNQYQAQSAPIIAQAALDQRKYQDDLNRWNQQFAAQQAQSQKGDYLQQQQLASQQSRDAFNQDLALRQQALAEAQLQMQSQAADMQNQNWWQQPLGNMLALGTYAVAPQVAPFVSGMWNQMTQPQQPQQSYQANSTNRFYQPGVGPDSSTQYYYDPNQFMQVKW